MTTLKLLEGLTAGLREAVAGLKYPAQEQENKGVSVYLQSIPAASGADTLYPLILVELLGIEDEADGAIASVLITIITYDSDARGYYDNFSIADRVRRWLLTHQMFGSYALELPLNFGVVEKAEDDFTASNFLATYQLPHIDDNYNISDI